MFLDFLTGFLLMNAMPHLLFGLMRVRFLSAFGFSWQANLAYALLNVVVAADLFVWQHGLQRLGEHGILIGGLAMLLIYAVTGKFFVDLFDQRNERNNSIQRSTS